MKEAVGTRRSQILLPFAIGVCAFLVVVGPKVLDPTNIAWLQTADLMQHYLGWLFFRQSPWTLPPGSNPQFGLEVANSIVYSDSNPLLALLFKVANPLLPDVFQYTGWWILACFVLQSWFGWKLGGLITRDGLLRACISAFFALSPVMIWRLHPEIGHETLFAHFFILAALYLVLRPQSGGRRLWWALLIVGAVLVHAYLLVMVLPFWLADLYHRDEGSPLLEFVAVTGLMLLACWAAGYFGISTLITGGYGTFRFDLAGFFDPGQEAYGLWSRLLPDLPGDTGQHEGFAYLGLGMIALAALAVIAVLRGRSGLAKALSPRLHVILPLILLAAFAATHHLRFAGQGFDIPLPAFLMKIATMFRSSGRMIWPLYYGVFLLVFFAVIRGYGPRMAKAALVAGLALQILDTSAGWGPIRQNTSQPSASTWPTPLKDPFWQKAGQTYDNLRLVPNDVEALEAEWRTLAQFAGTHGMGTDAVYLARLDTDLQEKLRAREKAMLASGRYDKHTLYVLSPRVEREALENLSDPRDALLHVDGRIVVAPGWKALSQEGQKAPLAQ